MTGVDVIFGYGAGELTAHVVDGRGSWWAGYVWR